MTTKSSTIGYFLTTATAAIAAVSSVGAADSVVGKGANEPNANSYHSGAESVPIRSDFQITYGPTEEEAERIVSGASNILDVYRSLGAAYSVHEAGKTMIYRWGHGIDSVLNGKGSIVRNELLVFADSTGAISGFTYKNKANLTDIDALFVGAVSDAP